MDCGCGPLMARRQTVGRRNHCPVRKFSYTEKMWEKQTKTDINTVGDLYCACVYFYFFFCFFFFGVRTLVTTCELDRETSLFLLYYSNQFIEFIFADFIKARKKREKQFYLAKI